MQDFPAIRNALQVAELVGGTDILISVGELKELLTAQERAEKSFRVVRSYLENMREELHIANGASMLQTLVMRQETMRRVNLKLANMLAEKLETTTTHLCTAQFPCAACQGTANPTARPCVKDIRSV